MSDTTPARAELVALSERAQHLDLVRALVVVATAGWLLVAPETMTLSARELLIGLGAGMLTVAALRVSWHATRRRSLWLFGVPLLVDALVIAWVAYGTGFLDSALLLLASVHVVAIALLASYRTAVKLCVWHSIVLVVVRAAHEARVIEGDVAPGSLAEVGVVLAGLWVIALAVASFSAVNERELRRRRYDLQALAAMSQDVEGATDPADAAERALSHVCETFVSTRAVLFGLGDEGFVMLAHRGGARPGKVLRPDEGSVLSEAATTGRTLLRSALDPSRDGLLAALLPQAHHLAVVPLRAEERVVAVLVVELSDIRGARVEARVIETLERFADQIALVLRNLTLLEEMRLMAATDALTRIANRGTFENALQREVARARRTGEPVSLAIFDVDHFKKLNDTYGHQRGDDVLKSVAALLDAASRTSDLVARYGGEEFVALMPGTPAETGWEVAERLRVSLAAADEELDVTASAGLATFPDNALDPAALLKAADDALYASKHAGRDRLTMAIADPTDDVVVVPDAERVEA